MCHRDADWRGCSSFGRSRWVTNEQHGVMKGDGRMKRAGYEAWCIQLLPLMLGQRKEPGVIAAAALFPAVRVGSILSKAAAVYDQMVIELPDCAICPHLRRLACCFHLQIPDV